MYLLFVTLVFSLALGPDVQLLNAQEVVTEHMSMPSKESTFFSQVSESSRGENSLTTAEATQVHKNPLNNESLETETENVARTSDEHLMTSSSEHLTIAELLNTTESLSTEVLLTTLQHRKPPEPPTTEEHLTTAEHLTTEEHLTTGDHLTTGEHLTTEENLTTPEATDIPVQHTNMTTHAITISATAPKSTSQPEQEDITVANILTTEVPQTSSPASTIPDPTTKSTKPSVSTPKPASIEEIETTKTSPTTKPTTTTITTETPDRNIWTHSKEIMSTINNNPSLSDSKISKDNEESKKGPKWLIIGVIALVIFSILTIFCVIAIIKRKKHTGKQSFGYMNGQRSKKKKGAEDDVWAGPVDLGGGDCEAPEDGDLRGEEKKVDGVEEKGLSTFVTLEENGGVGRPGSPEVEKWEEKERLLYIDEEGKQKGKEAGKTEDAGSKDEVGKTDAKEAEHNGGETFCLTTAV